MATLAKWQEGQAIGLEGVAGSCPVQLLFLHSLLFTMRSSLACLSFNYTMVHRPSSLIIYSNKNLVFIISWCGNFKGRSG